jgi:hypothetical protein
MTAPRSTRTATRPSAIQAANSIRSALREGGAATSSSLNRQSSGTSASSRDTFGKRPNDRGSQHQPSRKTRRLGDEPSRVVDNYESNNDEDFDEAEEYGPPLEEDSGDDSADEDFQPAQHTISPEYDSIPITQSRGLSNARCHRALEPVSIFQQVVSMYLNTYIFRVVFDR